MKRLYDTYSGLSGGDVMVDDESYSEEYAWEASPISPEVIALIESLADSDEERFKLVSSHNYRREKWGDLFNEKWRFKKVIKILSHFVETGTFYELTPQTLSAVVRKIGGRYDEIDSRDTNEIWAGYPGYREYTAHMTVAQALGLTPEQMNQLFSNPMLDSASLILNLLQKGYAWDDIQSFIMQHGLTHLNEYETTRTDPRCTTEICTAAHNQPGLIAALIGTPWTTEGMKDYITSGPAVSEGSLQYGINLIKDLERLEGNNSEQISRARRLAVLCNDPPFTNPLRTAIDLLNKHTDWPTENKVAFLESLYKIAAEKYSTNSRKDNDARLKVFQLAVAGLNDALLQKSQTAEKILELAALSKGYDYSKVDPKKFGPVFYRNLAMSAVRAAHPEYFKAHDNLARPANKILEIAADRGYMDLESDFLSLFKRLVPDIKGHQSLSYPYDYSDLSSQYLEFYLAVMELTDLSIGDREKLLENIHQILSQNHSADTPTLFSQLAKITPEIARRFVASYRQRPTAKKS
ncbi:MAG: hypothetical protein IPJ69_02260 [Deltaproteobacteria bacterium]|nr:MAG: hypothetical protein IPJ69_02260 [Deltaproteobacteria bacterium]